jgi:hypothetical protein
MTVSLGLGSNSLSSDFARQAALKQFNRQVYLGLCSYSQGAGSVQQRSDSPFQFTRGIAYSGKTEGGAGPGQAVCAALQGRQRFYCTVAVQDLVPEQLDLRQSLGQCCAVISALQL